MGMHPYNDIYVGVRLSGATLASMKTKTEKFIDVPPKTKFDPNTGKLNPPVRTAITEMQWKNEYKEFGDLITAAGDDNLYNGNVDFHGFKLSQTFNSDGSFLIFGESYNISSEKDGFEKLTWCDDLSKVKEKMKAALEPLLLWNDEWFGVWKHTYWA
jgi:hypothetical protein